MNTKLSFSTASIDPFHDTIDDQFVTWNCVWFIYTRPKILQVTRAYFAQQNLHSKFGLKQLIWSPSTERTKTLLTNLRHHIWTQRDDHPNWWSVALHRFMPHTISILLSPPSNCMFIYIYHLINIYIYA